VVLLLALVVVAGGKLDVLLQRVCDAFEACLGKSHALVVGGAGVKGLLHKGVGTAAFSWQGSKIRQQEGQQDKAAK
jgi:hypothetical protein